LGSSAAADNRTAPWENGFFSKARARLKEGGCLLPSPIGRVKDSSATNTE
jgi:hypothetical protein